MSTIVSAKDNNKLNFIFNFTRTTTYIKFQDYYSTDSIVIQVNVKYDNSNTFDVSYNCLTSDEEIKTNVFMNHYEGNKMLFEKMKRIHPLTEMVNNYDDESLFQGSIVPINPITFHIIESLMKDSEKGDTQYNTGVVTESCYKGQLMQALAHLEI